MSDETEDAVIHLPAPPKRMQSQHHMVYGEWTIVQQSSTIATADNPNPQGGARRHTLGLNEVTNLHPLVYAVAVQPHRPGYVVKWAMPISKQLYDWHMNVQQTLDSARNPKPEEKAPSVEEQVEETIETESQTVGS